MKSTRLRALKAGLCLILGAGPALAPGFVWAQIIHMPPVAMTVADCRPGDSWQVRNGVERCQPILPPDSCANHGLYAVDQGGGATFVPSVGTCFFAYTPPPPLGHVLVASSTFSICSTIGTVQKYADGIYVVTNDNLGGPVSGTWDPVLAAAPYRKMPAATPYIPEPADSAYAVSYLAQAYFDNNPWDCAGGVG